MAIMDDGLIQTIYSNCNSISLEDLLKYILDPHSGITVDGLKNAGYKKIELLSGRYTSLMEDRVWNENSNTLDGLEIYLSRYPNGKYIYQAKDAIKRLQAEKEEEDWAYVKAEHNAALIENYIKKCESNIYTTIHLEEARRLHNEFLLGSFTSSWGLILSTEDFELKKERLNRFLSEYKSKQYDIKYQAIYSDALKMQEGLRDDEIAKVDWLEVCKKNTLMDYVDFVRQHPYSSFRKAAEEQILSLKGPILTDMKLRPFAYSREMMYSLISTNTLTQKDLVDDTYILTDRAYNHILEYPTLKSEQRQLPVSTRENPQSEPGNTDVYFFGVSGSGKTCVLAGLLSLDGQNGFSFDPKGIGGGGNYAMDLQRYARKSSLPPATDQQCIQVIDAEITNDNTKRKISLIEMAGEKTAQLASIEDPSSFDDLGPGAAGLLNNDNYKLLFFVIDPINEKDIKLGGNKSIIVQQSNVMNCVASIISKKPDFLKKVLSVHIILTKSDSLGDNLTTQQIMEVLREQNYLAPIERIKEMCRQGRMNSNADYEVHLTPFCLGTFRPGDVYTFNDYSSTKILEVIRKYTPIPKGSNSFWDRIKNFFTS